MLPIAQVQRLATSVPPHEVTGIILLVAAALTLLIGLVRERRGLLGYGFGVAYVAAGAVMWLPTPMLPDVPWARPAAFAVAVVALLLQLMVGREQADEAAAGEGSVRVARAYLVATLALAAFLLFDRLGSYFGILVSWESTVLDGFATAFEEGQGVLTYAARRFLWDDGILSAGHTSLFYGAPTYALVRWFGFSPWMLRVCSALATLLSILVVYELGARFFGRVAGAAVAALLALNPAVLFYGRFGSSPAGTMLAILLALLCVWIFLDRDRWAWWMGPVTAAALFVATLQYSPARIIVLILLGVVGIMALLQWRRLWWRRGLGLVLIIAAVLGVRHFEQSAHRDHLFLNARGEQFFSFMDSPELAKGLFGKDLVGRDFRPAQITLPYRVAVLTGVLQTTIPQYVDLLTPSVQRPVQGAAINIDPPPLSLYYAPAAIFILWGFGFSVFRFFDWRHFSLLAWVAGSTVPLLLTNRVDAHRTMLFVVPLTIWGALGVREATRAMAAAKVPVRLQHVLAGMLIATVIYANVNTLYLEPDKIPKPVSGSAIATEIASVPGPVLLGWDWDHREVGWVRLAMLERERQQPGWRGTILPEGTLIGTINEVGREPSEVEVRNLHRFVEKATVLLAPADRFRSAAALLQRRGVRVSERGTGRFQFFRIDAGAAATGLSDEDVKPLPTIVITPTPTPIPLRGGPQVSLSALEPASVEFGFAAPQIDREWDNPPITLGGVRYDHGIGMHAWCRMTYAVPPNAVEFQAIVGIADKMRECPRAAVIFEVRDDKDAVLFHSGLVDGTTPPMPIHADVRGKGSVTLVVTDAGNGIDCDHADWALPSFLLSR